MSSQARSQPKPEEDQDAAGLDEVSQRERSWNSLQHLL